jgi:hypothetical protein
MSNRNLLIVFITCLTLFFAGKFFRSNRSASFDPVVVAVDTSQIDRIKFIAGGPSKAEFELVRVDTTWEAIQGNIKVKLEPSARKTVLASLSGLNANRVVTKEASKYPEFEIDDAQASKVIVWQGKKQVAELAIGGFRFNQQAQTASTFVRKGDKPEVYLIDGFAGLALKARFDQFRDKKLVKTIAADLTSLEWVNATGYKQKIQKEEGVWYYAGMEAVDSASFTTYLGGLVNAQGTTFSELTSTQGLTLAEKLTLYGNNMNEPTTISAFISPDTIAPFLIHSTANPDALFNSDSTGLYKKIFSDLRQFWPDGQ